MRRLFALSLLLTTLSAVTVAQTLRVNVGQVTYAHRAAAVGNMTFANGSTLTVQGMTYNVANVSDITIDANEVADNTVSVNYSGSTANIVVAGNIAPYLTISAQGAKVSIVQSADLQQEVSYTLTGSSTNGSFVMDGEYKANFINISDPIVDSAEQIAEMLVDMLREKGLINSMDPYLERYVGEIEIG
jgi:hypothetical protein